MRPIWKELPPERADYTFGDLVYWHFFKYGTRPDGDPAAPKGRIWRREDAARALGMSDRALRNWINNVNPPKDIARLLDVLFGADPRWLEARIELQDKFDNWLREIAAARPQESFSQEQDKADLSGKAEDPPLTGSEGPGAEPPPEASAPPESDPLASTPNATSEGDQLAQGPNPGTPEPERKPEGEGEATYNKESRPSAALIPLRRPPLPDRDRRIGLSPKAVRSIVAGIALILGAYGTLQFVRDHGQLPASRRTPETASAPKPEPKIVQVEEKVPVVIPPPPPPVEEPPKKIDPPPQTGHSDPNIRAALEPPRQPTPEERRADEETRLAEKLIAARQAAHDLEMQRRDEEAVRLDREGQAQQDAETQRRHDARVAAGLGFELQENRYIPASAFRNMLTASAADCALACIRDGCDAFAWYRDQYPAEANRPRYCYLHRKPFVPSGNPGYTLGIRVPEGAGERQPRRQGALQDAPVRLAQAGPPTSAPLPATEGLVRCSGGPVKVTGFTLACDRTTDGGTTLGSHRLRYTVSNINECAAKCRPIRECTGFAYNSSEPPGQQACIIFGGRTETRESKGWISGAR